jgi:hypothetical protein
MTAPLKAQGRPADRLHTARAIRRSVVAFVGVAMTVVSLAGQAHGDRQKVGTGAQVTADFTSSEIIRALNAQRQANGIPPVRSDPQMAAGCAAYDKYVIRNGLSVADEHYEIPGKRGYTAAGDHAARTSVLGYLAAATPAGLAGFGWAFGDPWGHAAFHLFQLVNPALAVSGGDERTARLTDGQWVRLECVNTYAGPFRTPPAKLHVYFYPGSGSTIPASELNEEGESVLGVRPGTYGPPIVFAYYFGRGVHTIRVTSIKATLNARPFSVVAAYAGGASGPVKALRDILMTTKQLHRTGAAAAPANPTAGFYTPIPASPFELNVPPPTPKAKAVMRLLTFGQQFAVAFEVGD